MNPPAPPRPPAPDRESHTRARVAADDPAWRAALDASLSRVALVAREDGALAARDAAHAQRRRRWPWPGMALALGALSFLGTAPWWAPWVAPVRQGMPGLAPPPAMATAPPPRPAEPPPAPGDAVFAALRRPVLVADPTDAAGPALARTLAAALGDAAGPLPSPLPARGWSDMLERLDVDQPRLAVARYDALRLAQPSAAAPLSVLMPLFPHEVQVLVRADSPLRHLHELRGLRINAGPGAGARRLSARTLYGAMFDAPLPSVPGAELDEADALQALLRGELDAVVLVAPQPAPPLAALPASQARALRLLALDERHPASRRVLETFLPARLQPGRFAPGLLDAPLPAPALMSFLVTGGRRTPQADAALGRFAAALCAQLPLLARLDPAWRGVDPRRRLPTGWPTAAAAEAALRDCAPAPPR